MLLLLGTNPAFPLDLTAPADKPFSFGLRGGEAFPLGQFASKGYPDGGYALYGRTASMEASWFPFRYLGLCFTTAFAEFPFHDGAYAQDMVNGDPFMTQLQVVSTPYPVSTYTGGLLIRCFPLKRLSAAARLARGRIFVETPDQLHEASYYMIGRHDFKKTPATDRKEIWQAGMVLSYRLFSWTEIQLAADYTAADMVFGFTRPGGESYTRKLALSFVGLTLGAALIF